MPAEKLRRLAGASGGLPTDEETVLAAGRSKPNSEATAPQKRSPEEVHKVLHPDVISFDITRRTKDPESGELVDRPFKLMVPTVFTIGDIVQKEADQDFDAYVRLVLAELATISGNPNLLFAQENLQYLNVVLGASNVRRFLKQRVLAKVAYLVDPAENDPDKHYTVVAADLDKLGHNECLIIGMHYVGRWMDNLRIAREAAAEATKNGALSKNAAGTA
jgi:hypothetical protein